MPPPLTDLLLALQLFVVLFIALHDWISLGPFNDVESVQSAESVPRTHMTCASSA